MPITKINSLGVNLTSPLTFSAGTVSLPSITFSGDTNTGVFAPAADTVAFTEGGTEALRINSSGLLLVGGTSALDSETRGSFVNSGSTQNVVIIENTNNNSSDNVLKTLMASNADGTDSNHLTCGIRGVANRLFIRGNGNIVNANNSYGSISDLKLKQDIVDAGSQWNDIKNIKVRKYRYKDNPTGNLQIGVIAQELESFEMSGLVEENYDEIRDTNKFLENGITPNPNYWRLIGISETEKTKQVKYSVLYMKAVKALQEAMERIEQLEARLTALENN